MDDEIHNIQLVINSLSHDILHEDLSHLTGESICSAIYSNKIKPDYVSIEYLLDIFRCIHDWIASRLDSMNTPSTSKQIETIEDKTLQDSDDDNALFQEYIKQKEDFYAQIEQETDVSSTCDDLFQQHLEQYDQFEKLHQELEENYLSDLSTANTSAFSYRASNQIENTVAKKVVTFPDQTTNREPSNQIATNTSE